VLPVVHDADDDRTRFGCDLDQVETGFLRDAPGFFDGNDADLFAAGADETDGTEADLVIDANLFVDATPPRKSWKTRGSEILRKTVANIASASRRANR
jgi:hypothetical protein